ncbi:MAG: hypothetical protein ABIO83_06050 [Ilumatobacteraceae bacterium]
MASDRDPVQRVVDVAFGLPVAVFVATRRAIPLIARTARRRALPLVDAATHIEPITIRDIVDPPPGGPAEPVAVEVLGELPIDGYDHLAARQVIDRLPELDPGELALIAEYERIHRNRQTVLRKIEQLG